MVRCVTVATVTGTGGRLAGPAAWVAFCWQAEISSDRARVAARTVVWCLMRNLLLIKMVARTEGLRDAAIETQLFDAVGKGSVAANQAIRKRNRAFSSGTPTTSICFRSRVPTPSCSANAR